MRKVTVPYNFKNDHDEIVYNLLIVMYRLGIAKAGIVRPYEFHRFASRYCRDSI